ncbi:MAG: ferritin-like domain-containing protein [Betaproteobacteria bacterium]|nr:ferritin-like domain-containing protein [Betaproteobacteria bacterium]
MELRHEALRLLAMTDPAEKAAAVRTWHADRHADGQATGPDNRQGNRRAVPPIPAAAIDTGAVLEPAGPLPGRPPRPLLVDPALVPRRTPFTPTGRAALLHAVAHIEFNAINLALDAIWRFPGLPAAYYLDWQRVAAEEALHFTLIADHLATLGHAYGDFDAHDGLWKMCEKTAADVLARMALVPRTLEARGLDATPPMRAKFARVGDTRAAEILDVILRDEIGHVAIGNRWYRWLCAREGLDPVAHYALLAARHGAPRLKGPFNVEARRAAGFSDDEVAALGAQ